MWSKHAKISSIRLPCESCKPQARPLTTAFIIFSDTLTNECRLQLAALSGCVQNERDSQALALSEPRLHFHPEYGTHVVMMLQELDNVMRTKRVLAFFAEQN